MPHKLTYNYVFEYIKEKGYELLSTEYRNLKSLLDMKCRICNERYKQSFSSFKQGYYHPFCVNSEKILFGGYKKPVTLKNITCPVCTIEFKPKRFDTKLCSRKCSQEYSRREEYKEIAKKNGSKGGKISATSQGRRSQNEIYFAEKCETYFGKENVTTNQAVFDGFDCDVIIHKEKLAIAWNGQWHYKQISKIQSLEQVQARDLVKSSIITNKYGYRLYVIKDTGKYDRNFVDQEFEIMLMCLMDV
jgi:hypothetical protein